MSHLANPYFLFVNQLSLGSAYNKFDFLPEPIEEETELFFICSFQMGHPERIQIIWDLSNGSHIYNKKE